MLYHRIESKRKNKKKNRRVIRRAKSKERLNMTNQQPTVRLTREQLGVQIGDQVVIKGYVRYARIAEKIDGAELERENANRLKQGRPAATAPFYHLVITSPEIIAGQGTPLAKFYEQRFYRKEGTDIVTIDFESKTVLPIPYGQMTDDYTAYMPINDPGKNPAEGQEVFLTITAFGDKDDKTKKMGSTFDAIIYGPGEIKFYEGGDRLANFGKALNLTRIENPNYVEPTRQNTTNQTPQVTETAQATQESQQPTGAGQAFNSQAQPTQTAQTNPFNNTTQATQENTNANTNPFNGANTTANPSNNPFM